MTLKHLISLYLARLAARRKSQGVRQFRTNVGAGDDVFLFHDDGQSSQGTVLNVRVYAHGPKEVFVQGGEAEFSGWFSVEKIMPTPIVIEEQAPRDLISMSEIMGASN